MTGRPGPPELPQDSPAKEAQVGRGGWEGPAVQSTQACCYDYWPSLLFTLVIIFTQVFFGTHRSMNNYLLGVPQALYLGHSSE